VNLDRTLTALLLLTATVSSAGVSAQPAKPSTKPAQAAATKPAESKVVPLVVDNRPAHVKRGEYLMRAAGCQGCHTTEDTDAVPFAGGRALKTPFGTFYGPNITPDPNAGIGGWKETDFVRAIRNGVDDEGQHLYPAFPYPSFTKMSDADIHDLWAYLRSIPPSARQNQPHDLKFPFKWRLLLGPWKWLFFKPGPPAADPKLSATVNRGAYIVNVLAHCGECHTDRNLLGATKADRMLAGVKAGKEGTPNITPAKLKKWSDAELKEFFLTGITPEFDSADATMGEVITNTTSKLTPDDLGALIAYLRQIPEVTDK
jgi:mono/diheme cytochrome c family protein